MNYTAAIQKISLERAENTINIEKRENVRKSKDNLYLYTRGAWYMTE